MEEELRLLSRTRPVCITTVPPRYDANYTDPIHYEIALANNYIRELVFQTNQDKLIDSLDDFESHFSRHGKHLNGKGKRKLAFLIINFVEAAHMNLNKNPKGQNGIES